MGNIFLSKWGSNWMLVDWKGKEQLYVISGNYEESLGVDQERESAVSWEQPPVQYIFQQESFNVGNKAESTNIK